MKQVPILPFYRLGSGGIEVKKLSHSQWWVSGTARILPMQSDSIVHAVKYSTLISLRMLLSPVRYWGWHWWWQYVFLHLGSNIHVQRTHIIGVLGCYLPQPTFIQQVFISAYRVPFLSPSIFCHRFLLCFEVSNVGETYHPLQ